MDKLIEAFKKHITTPIDYNIVRVNKDVHILLRLQNQPVMQGREQAPAQCYIILAAHGAKLVESGIDQAQYYELIKLLKPEYEKYKEELINSL